jgi:hypothetical protein
VVQSPKRNHDQLCAQDLHLLERSSPFSMRHQDERLLGERKKGPEHTMSPFPLGITTILPDALMSMPERTTITPDWYPSARNPIITARGLHAFEETTHHQLRQSTEIPTTTHPKGITGSGSREHGREPPHATKLIGGPIVDTRRSPFTIRGRAAFEIKRLHQEVTLPQPATMDATGTRKQKRIRSFLEACIARVRGKTENSGQPTGASAVQVTNCPEQSQEHPPHCESRVKTHSNSQSRILYPPYRDW